MAANWKMNLTHEEVTPYLDRFLTEVGELTEVEVILIPSFTAIPALAYTLERSPTFVELGTQNVHWEKGGAFTGEASVAMLRALQVKYVAIGHSERRLWLGVTDEAVGKKVGATLKAGLLPLLCVGETLPERDENRVEEVLERQLRKGLGGCSPQDLSHVVIAYEPVWAIGTAGPPRLLRPKKRTRSSGRWSPRFLISRPRRASESNTGEALSRITRKN